MKNAVTLFADTRHKDIDFALRRLRSTLEARGRRVFLRNISDFDPGFPGTWLAATPADKDVLTQAMLPGLDRPDLPEGAFTLKKRGQGYLLLGGASAGVMYGLLDLAEKLESGLSFEELKEDEQTPHLELRGIKFNLPFEPYDDGDPFIKNRETCLNRKFWEDFLDFMALHRYNFLSLWSEHPWHMMFRLEKYPETCPFSDTEIHDRKELFKFIFRRAKERGIRCALITWNIRINRQVAKGLGLPEELGDMEDQYFYLHDKFNYLPNNIKDSYNLRQNQEIIKDYFKECIKTLLFTYRDLHALGTNCAEEMKGDPAGRQQWVREVYSEAVAESGRDIPFIMRTNMGNGKIAAEGFLNDYSGSRSFLSWKYSNAHMYSHPEPQFEKLWDAWNDMEFGKTKILYTVRNDDFHCFRGAAPVSFFRDYFGKMNKEHVAGYYWGADGYLWGDDFQHAPLGHKDWDWDFQRQWYQFALIGRMSYNPQLPESYWEGRFTRLYGDAGSAFFRGFQAAGRLIPAVNRLIWINFDYEWHPESLLSIYGLKSVLDFLRSEAMPAIGTLGLRDSVRLETDPSYSVAGASENPETAGDILKILENAAAELDAAIKDIRRQLPAGLEESEAGCVLNDLECWLVLNAYYRCKISAAMDLARYEITGDSSSKAKASALLTDALEHWDRLSALWSRHYLPYMMVRSKRWFGYPLHREEVVRDIRLAESYSREDWGDERKWIGGNSTVI